MHAQLVTPTGFTLMASDTPNSMDIRPGGSTSLSLSGDDADALVGFWEGLSEGATIVMPLSEAPWGGRFGMLADRFGTPWMVNAPAA